MIDAVASKKDLLDYVKTLNDKYQLSLTRDEDYFEPGMMENLEQYKGEYDETKNTITLRVESKGMRYENRTQNLEKISVNDSIQIKRDSANTFNSNNFTIESENGLTLGNLPADLCNTLAPLYDSGYATILTSTVSYIEKLRERSRYAKQGVMFVELHIKMRGV